MTFHYNRPDFIELQHKTLSKFLKDDFEFIVFNDARTPENVRDIERMCEKLGVFCFRYKQEWHISNPLNDEYFEKLNDPSLVHSHIHIKAPKRYEEIATHPSLRHSRVIQYALDHYGYGHDDIIVILDGDMFPIRTLSIRKLLEYRDIIGLLREAAVESGTIDYLWVPFIAFDPNKMPDIEELRFHPTLIKGFFHDTGAQSFYYLKNHPDLRVSKYQGRESVKLRNKSIEFLIDQGFSKREARLIRSLPKPISVQFHLENHLLHFGSSSFEDIYGYDIKTEELFKFFKKIL